MDLGTKKMAGNLFYKKNQKVLCTINEYVPGDLVEVLNIIEEFLVRKSSNLFVRSSLSQNLTLAMDSSLIDMGDRCLPCIFIDFFQEFFAL